MKRTAGYLAFLPLLMATSALAQAPDASGGEQDANSPPQVGDIVVTAQRRNERLQDVPIAVSAVSGDNLAKAGIRDAADLPLLAPSLNMASTGTYLQPRLRGVGTLGNGPGIEGAVAIYIDGVYIAQPVGGISDLSNVRSVEVINGPQGTLFGRNATGGLIQIRTLDPKAELSGNVSIGYANYDTVSASGYITGGSEVIAADFAFNFSDQGDGYSQNLATGSDVDFRRSISLRSKIKLTPGDDFTFTLAGDYQRMRYSTNFTTPEGSIPLGGFGTVRVDPRDSDGLYDPRGLVKSGGLSLTAEYDAGSFVAKSITAYRESDNDNQFNGQLTSNPAFASNLRIQEKHKQWSQEIQLASDSSGPLTWTAGGYLFWETSGYYPVRLWGPWFTPVNITIDSENRTRSQAVYAQGTYRLADTTRLTVGLRYSWEQRDADIAQTIRLVGYSIPFADGPVIDNPTNNDSESAKALTARLALDHNFTPDILGYVSYNRGFKSGGLSNASPTAPSYRPETIDAYEVGLKTNLFDRRLRFNSSAFYYNYSDIQVQALTGGILTVYNGAKARLYGLDVDTEAAVSSRLTLRASGSLLRTKYLSFPTALLSTSTPVVGGTTFSTFEAKGNRLPFSPNFVGSLGFDYVVPSEMGDFRLNGTYTYNDGFVGEPDQRLRQKAYHMVNAAISWVAPDKNLEMSLFVRNLADEDYAQSLFSQPQGDIVQYAPPRTYGVTLKYNFGL